MYNCAQILCHMIVVSVLSMTALPVLAGTPGDPQANAPTPSLLAKAETSRPISAPQPRSVANISLAANEHPPGTTNRDTTPKLTSTHPAATPHLPPFITAPGETDILMNVMIGFLGLILILALVFYFRLHALPEHIAHRGGVVQYQLVAVLALISLFTHNHIYWILGLLLALVRLPDFATPLEGIAGSLARIAEGERRPPAIEPVPSRQRAAIQQPVAERKDLSHA
jgi:hypothetical protein